MLTLISLLTCSSFKAFLETILNLNPLDKYIALYAIFKALYLYFYKIMLCKIELEVTRSMCINNLGGFLCNLQVSGYQ